MIVTTGDIALLFITCYFIYNMVTWMVKYVHLLFNRYKKSPEKTTKKKSKVPWNLIESIMPIYVDLLAKIFSVDYYFIENIMVNVLHHLAEKDGYDVTKLTKQPTTVPHPFPGPLPALQPQTFHPPMPELKPFSSSYEYKPLHPCEYKPLYPGEEPFSVLSGHYSSKPGSSIKEVPLGNINKFDEMYNKIPVCEKPCPYQYSPKPYKSAGSRTRGAASRFKKSEKQCTPLEEKNIIKVEKAKAKNWPKSPKFFGKCNGFMSESPIAGLDDNTGFKNIPMECDCESDTETDKYSCCDSDSLDDLLDSQPLNEDEEIVTLPKPCKPTIKSCQQIIEKTISV